MFPPALRLLLVALVPLLGGAAPRSATGQNVPLSPQGQQGAARLKLIRTVQVTPDATFKTGSFARINYVPATDRLVVTFGTKVDPLATPCQGSGYAYKEYTADMQEADRAGTLLSWSASECEAGDSGSLMVGSAYYLLNVPQGPGYPSYGWLLTKFDAATWTTLADTFIVLDDPEEGNLDPTVAFINGQLDLSDQYNPAGVWPDGGFSHHHFYSPDLAPQGTRILSDSLHISGAGMIQAGGFIYLVSANRYDGDLVVLTYDATWNFIGMKELRKMAYWSQGLAFDGQRFYVAYLDTSQRDPEAFFPVHHNVRLAAFDRAWDLIDDVAVTEFVPADLKQPGRPWVILHANKLYVSYDCDTIDPGTLEEERMWQAWVSIYELQRVGTVRRALRSRAE